MCILCCRPERSLKTHYTFHVSCVVGNMRFILTPVYILTFHMYIHINVIMSQQVTCCLVIRPLLSSNVGDNKNNYDNDNAIFRRKWSIRFSCRSIIVYYFNSQNNCHQGCILHTAIFICSMYVQWGIQKRPVNGESFFLYWIQAFKT